MKTPRYELFIYWSNVDQAFVVEVPELPGCKADGKTYAEAAAKAETAISTWIEAAKEKGDSAKRIPSPKLRGRNDPKWDPHQLDAKEAFEIVHKEVHNEHLLISHRMTWYVTSQAFLMAAFAASGSNDHHFPWLAQGLPVVGLVISFVILRALNAALQAMKEYRGVSHTIEMDPGLRALPFKRVDTEYPHIHKHGMLPPRCLPIVFIAAWIAALIGSLFFRK